MNDIRSFTTIEEFDAEEALILKEKSDIDVLNETISHIDNADERAEFIHNAHDKYNYVRYDYLADRFAFYDLRAFNVRLHKELFVKEKKKRNIGCLNELGDRYIDSQLEKESMLHFFNYFDNLAFIDLS